MLQPFGKFVAVRRDVQDETVIGGILVPRESRADLTTGEVVAVGDVPGLAVGDRVLFREYGIHEVRHEGAELLIMEPAAILALL